MPFFYADFTSRVTIIESVERIADKISKNVLLKFNDAIYYIMDFEFYIYSKESKFSDRQTYKNDLQLQDSKLYIHASGVDIRFGDGENHAGILLRSVIKS